MIASIQFNNQSLRDTHEICDIISYDMLAFECLTKCISSQILPKQVFCFRGMIPVILCMLLEQLV